MVPAILTAGTIAILAFSWWASIKAKRFHGIFRFFAFESIFIIVVLNSARWFHNPFSVLHLFSWFFLISSILLAVHGFYLLHKIGKPEEKENAETTTKLVTQGAYRYIRHPLYASLILFTLGAFLKQITWINLVLFIITIISLILTAKVEEKEVIKKFGKAYEMYIEKTKMFLPFII